MSATWIFPKNMKKHHHNNTRSRALSLITNIEQCQHVNLSIKRDKTAKLNSESNMNSLVSS